MCMVRKIKKNQILYYTNLVYVYTYVKVECSLVYAKNYPPKLA